MPRLSPAVTAELSRAEQTLKRLVGEEIDTIEIKSLDAEDAPFLGRVVSKLSPMIGNLLERRIVQLLAEEQAGSGLVWQRQDPGFPDAALFNSDGSPVGAGFEIKAWYALSTELTGRFRESQRLLAEKDVRLVVVAWNMSHIVYGRPQVVGVLSVDALAVANARDKHYHQPPTYLTVQPGDTSARTANLQQTNVAGYRLQESHPTRIARAEAAAARYTGWKSDPASEASQDQVTELMNTFPYRLDTNFAKIDRVDQDNIEQFKRAMLRTKHEELTLRQWGQLLRGLSSKKDAVRAKAAARIEAMYPSL